MYSVLIVDDERFMREGIRRMISWEALGFDHVETAESGTKALACIQQHMPHVVITDVEMSNMNGLQLIRAMNEINPDIRIIVLTGHDNFAYVQECCRMDVQDYLLKPVEVDQLSEVIRSQVEKLEEMTKERRRRSSEARANVLAEAARLRREFQRYFAGASAAGEIEELLRMYHWKASDALCVALIAPGQTMNNEWCGRGDLQEMSMNSVCYEMVQLDGHGVSFRNEQNAMVLVLFEGEEHPEAKVLLEQIRTVLHNEYDLAEEVYLGTIVDTIGELPESYRQAMQMWEGSENPSGERVGLGQNAKTKQMMEAKAMCRVREMARYISHIDLVLGQYDDYWKLLSEFGEDREGWKRSWIHGITELYLTWVREKKETVDHRLTDLLIQAQQRDTLELYELGKEFLHNLAGESKVESKDVIANAKRYIDTHLHEDLSVTNLAGQFYLSVAYFSKLFKKTAGIGCNYYIMHQRMERAKLLLKKPGVRVAEVAEQVGYQDVNYFSLTFRKYTGMSPVDYMEQEVNR